MKIYVSKIKYFLIKGFELEFELEYTRVHLIQFYQQKKKIYERDECNLKCSHTRI